MFFISSKKLFSFSRYSSFCNFFPSFPLSPARRLCAYQGVRNIRFLEHFACVLVEWSRGMLAWGLGCSGSGGVFCGLGSWGGGVWGGFWFSCWVMHCGWGLISIFQEFFGSIGKVFILVWGLGAARLSFYGI